MWAPDPCIARGARLDTLRDDGLRLATPDTHLTVRPTVADHPRHIDLATADVVLLTMKSQDTALALVALSASAPADLAVVWVQNGVHNEHMAQRYFERVLADPATTSTFAHHLDVASRRCSATFGVVPRPSGW